MQETPNFDDKFCPLHKIGYTGRICPKCAIIVNSGDQLEHPKNCQCDQCKGRRDNWLDQNKPL